MYYYKRGSTYMASHSEVPGKDWVPGVGTESIYTHIDETHDGTQYDPIPYDGNMELTACGTARPLTQRNLGAHTRRRTRRLKPRIWYELPKIKTERERIRNEIRELKK